MNWFFSILLDNLPLTTTVKVHSDDFPTASVTLYFTVLVPIPISLGRLVSTFLSFIVKTTVNESFVIPGSFSISELSVNEKLQFTVDTFFPLSLSFMIVGPGQVRVGGLKSVELEKKKQNKGRQ